MSALPSPFLHALRGAFDAQTAATDLQRHAFAEFLQAGLPTTRLDGWKYTDLRRLATKQFQNAPRTPQVESPLLLPFAEAILFVDGALHLPKSLEKRSDGLQATVVARETHAPSAQVSSLPQAERAFERLNAAFAADALAMHVADHATLASPIYIAYVWTAAAADAMRHPRWSLTLGHHSRATLIEHHVGIDQAANLTNTVSSISVGAGAELSHTRLQDDATTHFDIHASDIQVDGHGFYRQHNYILGAALARSDVRVTLAAPEARVELHGLMCAHGAQHLDIRACIRHEASHTQSRAEYRGIADQRGRVVFNGKVTVVPNAQRIDAAQSSRNLLLSPHAEIDTRPELEIYADDVKCAHGATVGQLDDAALFYLQSRGIARSEARALLTHAFAAELIERIPEPALRAHVLSRFMQGMRAEAPE